MWPPIIPLGGTFITNQWEWKTPFSLFRLLYTNLNWGLRHLITAWQGWMSRLPTIFVGRDEAIHIVLSVVFDWDTMIIGKRYSILLGWKEQAFVIFLMFLSYWLLQPQVWALWDKKTLQGTLHQLWWVLMPWGSSFSILFAALLGLFYI